MGNPTYDRDGEVLHNLFHTKEISDLLEGLLTGDERTYPGLLSKVDSIKSQEELDKFIKKETPNDELYRRVLVEFWKRLKDYKVAEKENKRLDQQRKAEQELFGGRERRR